MAGKGLNLVRGDASYGWFTPEGKKPTTYEGVETTLNGQFYAGDAKIQANSISRGRSNALMSALSPTNRSKDLY
eukprot:CAMPEP_0184748120 /NCGR_PEP_ID=MMETSP0315-20130426/16167_1 /TAXON_ID=101924 /ORGANISM="Rhodosorus marinus, Strain UTEX LB 2760" /LENGTH=73 /DNA_ID=CAMNT_0027222633 /DNA_START=505 /DNA_END=726 /DNA_ORIENTATION=+